MGNRKSRNINESDGKEKIIISITRRRRGIKKVISWRRVRKVKKISIIKIRRYKKIFRSCLIIIKKINLSLTIII